MTRRDQALVPTGSVEPPKLVLAGSLDAASSRAFVHVDNRGNVRSPARYRVLEGMGYASLVAIPALPLLYGWLFGPLGLIVGGGLALVIGARRSHGFALQRAVRLLSASRVDEAEPLLTRIINVRWSHRRVRALAHHNLALCRALRGDFEGALAQARAAHQMYGRVWARSLYAKTVVYFQIALLVELERTTEARALLDDIGPAPDGEYLQIAHWGAELYVHLGEGTCPLHDEELHTRARKGLAMTAGATLLGLTAWAFHSRGDDDMARLLLSEAFDRLDTDRLERTMPRLYAWMEQHRPPRGEDPLDLD